MSKETSVPLEFEGESLESVFVGRRDLPIPLSP